MITFNFFPASWSRLSRQAIKLSVPIFLLGTTLTACTSEPAVKKPAVYVSSCEPCHGNGAGGAPITGDKEEWTVRLAKGREAVYQLAIVGFEGPNKTVMPAKGARKDLSDEEIKGLVDYMIQASQ